MGKNMTKKKKKARAEKQRRYLRAGVLSLLVVLGLSVMIGMAMFNASVKPQRDMKWYTRDGAVQVAAPAVGDGYAGSTQRGSGNGASLADIRADVTPRPTIRPTLEPRAMATLAPRTAPEAGNDPEAGDGQGDEQDLSDVFSNPSAQQSDTGAEAAPEDPSGTVTIKITAAGDCTFGGEMGSKGRRRFVDLVNREGFDYFFDGVRQVFEDDDMTIINLEGPLTKTEKTNKHGFVFKGDPEYVNIMTGSSVELCNLANNHILDYGKEGLRETVNVLDAAHIGYCGFTKTYNATIKGVRVSSLGFTWWDNPREEILQTVADARPNCDLLIVNIHWGVEGKTQQDHKQAALAHEIIDAGADLLIGTHPHVYQGIEKYKGKYIVYSLGNFCFAGNANPNDKRCLIFQQTFSFNPGMGIAQANITDSGINIIPCTVSSVDNLNDFQPTIMEAAEGGAMLKAVASRSTNFSLTDTKWLKDNYMIATGLISNDDGQGQQPVTADIEGGADAAEETPVEDAGEDAGEDINVL